MAGLLAYFGNITTTTAMPPLPPYQQESIWVWVAIGFLFPPAIYQYSLLLYCLITKINFNWFRTAGVRLLPESQSGRPSVRKWKRNCESVKVGSDPFTAKWPSFQVILWAKNDDGIYQANACGWRHGEYLVTASHCLTDGMLALSVPGSDICELPYIVYYNSDEIAIIKIDTSFYSEFGVTSAKITGNVDGMVRVTGSDVSMATTAGILKPTDVFAILKYSGSTKAGFSGAPYVVGDTQVVAMHLFGGDAGNLCVQATYIKMLIVRIMATTSTVKKAKFNRIPIAESRFSFGDRLKYNKDFESKKGKNKKRNRKNAADDWYEEDIVANQRINFRKSRFNPDEYEFELNGNYYVVDHDGLERLRRSAVARGAYVINDSSLERTSKRRNADQAETYGEESKIKAGVSDDDDFEQPPTIDTDSDDEDSDFLEEPTYANKLKNMDSRTLKPLNLSTEQQKLLKEMSLLIEESVISLKSNLLKVITHQILEASQSIITMKCEASSNMQNCDGSSL